MKQRFGALLCMLLGGALMVTGLAPGQAAVGVSGPTCVLNVGGIAPSCPTGTITVTEHTDQKGATLPLPAGGWKVDITSTNCTMPNGDPVAQTLTIADGGNATTADLFIFADPAHGQKCQYTLAETPVAGFAAAFDPPSPVTIPYTDTSSSSSSANSLVALADPPNNLAVALTNTSNVAPSTTPVTTSAAAHPSSSAAALAVTGPRPGVRVSLWIGALLFGLGLVVLLAGRRRRTHTH